MSRKLISLTDDNVNPEESISKLKSWEKNENPHVSKPSGEITSKADMSGKIVSQLSATSGKKFDIFDTKKVPLEVKLPKQKDQIRSVADDVVSNNVKSLVKEKRTLDIQRKMTSAREKKALEACLKGKEPEVIQVSDKVIYPSDKNISIESLQPADVNMKPQPASKTPSLILPQFHTQNFLKHIKPKTGIELNPMKPSTKPQKFPYDPREKQKLIDGKQVKVYKRGERLYVKLDENMDDPDFKKLEDSQRQYPLCRSAINVHASHLNLLTPAKKFSIYDLSLGKPYGIQPGSHNILNDHKTKDLKGCHALDVVIVAHGMSYIKHPANWSERDIDQILMMGSELYKATKDTRIDKLNPFTKGFTYRSNYIQVTLSEPVVIGRILTLTERSMDLYNGLQKFFGAYQQGIFETSNLVLYIMQENIGYYVFDPRGRDEQCDRHNGREAALMAFTSIVNVYHLILNLSGINTKGPFKISSVKVIQFMNKDYALNEYTAVSGNGGRTCRNDEYEMLDEIAYLRGTLNLNSPVFENLRNRHGLASSIMAIVYGKIDPPASWCRSTIDRVLHFGHKFHTDCLGQQKIARNLTLPEIPSKFYVGESYCVQIAIAAYFSNARLIYTRFAYDNPITNSLINSLNAFRCLLLEVDNCMFSVWRTEPAQIYYFFDPYQKNLDGDTDMHQGTSTLFVYETLDHLCEHLCKRILRIQHSDSTYLKVHGMKIIELKKLSMKEQKHKPLLRLANVKCIRPFTADDAQRFLDVPSTVDSVAPLLTKAQQLRALEQAPEQPLYSKVTDLNSPSLVCCGMRTYDDMMAAAEKKISFVRPPDLSTNSLEIMKEVQSEIIHKIDKCSSATDINKCLAEKSLKKSDKSCNQVRGWKKDPITNKWTPCGEYIGTAEKVLIKTDLDCLEHERDEIFNQSSDESVYEQEMKPKKELTLSQEKLIPSHFQVLPDKTQIISGTKSLYSISLEPDIYNYENLSVIVGIAAIITSTKYSIATWSSETVDYVLGCGHIMSGSIKLKHRLDFYTVSEHILPKVHIKEKFYDLQMKAIANGDFNLLECFLVKFFEAIDRFLFVTPCGSLAVFKIKNFYYLFEYATCNKVGYRIKNQDFGTSCFLRFDNLHSLVRRINANHCDIKDEQKFIIYRVMVYEAKDDTQQQHQGTCIRFTPSQEQIIIDGLRNNRTLKREELIKKLKENDAKINAEKERLKKYQSDTGVTDVGTTLNLDHTPFDESQVPEINETDYALDLTLYTDPTTQSQQPQGTETSQVTPEQVDQAQVDSAGQVSVAPDGKATSPCQQYLKDSKEIYGYGSNLFIRGTFGYPNRLNFSDEKKFRECHFACVYAVMFAVHHSFADMSYRSVDVILENGIRIFENLTQENYLKQMLIADVIVDNTSYNLQVKHFSSKKANGRIKSEVNFTQDDVDRVTKLELKTLSDFFDVQKYGIIKGVNCCLMVLYDKNSKMFHIFDPYDENDIIGATESIDNPLGSFSKHVNIKKVQEYLTNKLQKHDEPKVSFQLYHILISTYKKLKIQRNTGYFIFNTSHKKKNVEMKSCNFIDLAEDEKIEWITKTCKIPWSPLEKYNADCIKRYTRDSKWKEYDIERDMKLYSLWGHVHPNMSLFKPYSGKQHIACCIVSLILSNLYCIDEWDSVLLDSIILHGHKYLASSVRRLTTKKDKLDVADHNGFCLIQDFGYMVELELLLFGRLYDENRTRFNLNRALNFAFKQKKLPGVLLLCNGRSLAIGNGENQNYFMYDCQSYGPPLFKENQGTSYVLKCCCLKILIVCITLTLNVRSHNVKFYLYAMEARHLTDDETKQMKEDDEKAMLAAQVANPDQDVPLIQLTDQCVTAWPPIQAVLKQSSLKADNEKPTDSRKKGKRSKKKKAKYTGVGPCNPKFFI